MATRNYFFYNTSKNFKMCIKVKKTIFLSVKSFPSKLYLKKKKKKKHGKI